MVALVPNEQQMAAVTPNQLPMNYATGKPGTVKDVFSDGLAGYEHAFGKKYTYGRDVDLQFVTSTGDDEAAQRADAIAVTEMKPFAVLDAGTVRSGGLRHRDGAGEDPGVLALRRRRSHARTGPVPLGSAGSRRRVDERGRVHRQAACGEEGGVRR